MEISRVIEHLEKARANGAKTVITLQVIDNPSFDEAERLNTVGDFGGAASLYYSLFEKEKDIDLKMKYGVNLSQALINASNLDKAEEVLDDLKNTSGDIKFMGAIYEKRGWIADARGDYDAEIENFKKAKELYETIPGAIDVEGRSSERLLTVEHFIGRAMYSRQRESDLDECISIFEKNLESYRKLGKDGVVAFNYAWLARCYIAKKDFKKAEESAKSAQEYFEKTVTEYGERILSHVFRIKSELAYAKGNGDEALEYAIQAFRYNTPTGAYYNGAIEILELIVKASSL